MGSASIALALENAGRGWIRNLIPLLGLPPLETQNLCAGDPPGFVDMDAAEVFTAVADLNITPAVVTARQKLSQNLQTYAWYALCECASAATPAPPAVTIDEPNPLPLPAPIGAAGPCATATYAHFALGDNGFQNQPGLFHTGLAATSMNVTVDNQIGTGPGQRVHIVVGEYTTPSPAYSYPGAYIFDVDPGQKVIHNFAIHPGYDFVRVDSTTGAMGGTTDLTITVDVFCGGYPGPLPAAPCPADPVLLAQLDKLLQLVTLIQRQHVPFAYVPSSRHVGLVGSGQIAVQGLIGVSVILTTVPAYLGNIAGDPPELFDVGFVTLGTADGWTKSHRVDHNPTLIFPVDASVTTIGYSLEPNVVADVLELVREP